MAVDGEGRAPATVAARPGAARSATLGLWLLLATVPLNLAVPFAANLARAYGGIDDSLNLLLAGLATLDPSAHRERWERASAYVVATAPEDRGLRGRWELRGTYALNYRLSTLPVGLLARGAARFAPGASTAAIARWATPIGLAITWAGCVAILLAAIATAARERDRVALALGVALASLLAAAVGEHAHGEAVAFLWRRGAGEALGVALRHLASPGEFGFPGFSPRSAASLLVGAAFALRWTGRAAWGYAVLALCAGIHAVNAALIIAAIVTLDLLRPLAHAASQRTRAAAAIAVAVAAACLPPDEGWAQIGHALVTGGLAYAALAGASRIAARRVRSRSAAAMPASTPVAAAVSVSAPPTAEVPARPVLEIALLVAAVLATLPIVNAVFDLDDYRTFLTAGLLTGRALGQLSLPVSLAIGLACARFLPELARSGGRAIAVAAIALTPCLVWWRVAEWPARPFWTHVSSTVERSLARLADPRGPRLGPKEVADEGLWYSAIADDALRGSGAIDRLGAAVRDRSAPSPSPSAARSE